MKCADCGDSIYKDAEGKLASERRATKGTPPGGAERRAAASPPPPPVKPPEPEKPPRREHILNRPLFGGGKKAKA